eukprot:TRINITY_DN15557_c0_g1_i5.p1 TRINITY_DN15557_c0_g1~~TRINITY_DN15557_c0_g1_i5.p1  ORF type:complete len:324 (+),score=59.81 TRINITY_DN15557_c0_g1_i5:347-1318(+)
MEAEVADLGYLEDRAMHEPSSAWEAQTQVAELVDQMYGADHGISEVVAEDRVSFESSCGGMGLVSPDSCRSSENSPSPTTSPNQPGTELPPPKAEEPPPLGTKPVAPPPQATAVPDEPAPSDPNPAELPKGKVTSEADSPKTLKASWSVGSMFSYATSAVTKTVGRVFVKTAGGADLTDDTELVFDNATNSWVEKGKEGQAQTAGPPPPPKMERRKSDGDVSPTEAKNSSGGHGRGLRIETCSKVRGQGLATAPVRPQTPRAHLKSRYVNTFATSSGKSPAADSFSSFVPPVQQAGAKAVTMLCPMEVREPAPVDPEPKADCS